VLLAAMNIGADVANLGVQQLRVGQHVSPRPVSQLTTDANLYIEVDGEGKRFWQETSHALSGERQSRLTHLHEKEISTTMGEHTWWAICDSGCGAEEDTIAEELAAGRSYAGDTLMELAEAIGVPAENLVATVSRYNTLVDIGEDVDFGKHAEEVAYKIENPPFYAFPKQYRRHHTMGGLRINVNAQTLDRQNQVIPRLYSAGEINGNVHGLERDGGCGWNDIIVFGRRAGKHAGALPPSTL
jgi:fumarate reductase flavoprotein subunit